MKTRRLSLRFPTGGVHKRRSFQDQPPYTAYAAQNVWPDNVSDGRERGGVRPGLSRAVTGSLSNPIRMLHVVNVQTEEGNEQVLVASAGGNFYRYNTTDGDWDTISTTYSLADDRLVLATPHKQKLYIADWGLLESGTTLEVSAGSATVVHLTPDVEDTNGVTDGAGTTFTSEVTSATDGTLDAAGTELGSSGSTFVTDGVTPTTHVVRISDTGAGGNATTGVYAISSVDDENTITLATSAGTTETGVDFEVNLDFANAGVTNADYLRVLDTGDGAAATIDAYEISTVTQDQLTLIDAASSGAETGIDFEVRPPINSSISSLDHALEVLDSGNGTAGFYVISSVEEDQITLGSSPGSTGTTGIHYRIHRVPKVWDLATNDITKWTATAGELPLSCNVITTWHDRVILAGAPSYPQVWYASKQGDPTNFDYEDDSVDSAVAGNNYLNGEIGDPITALIPHNRQCLVIGAKESLYVLRGDPAEPSSTLDQLSGTLGPVSPQAWCKDKEFRTWMLTRDGLYVMPPGCGDTPTSFSREKIPDELLSVDVNHFTPLLEYDVLQRAVHVYVTNNAIGVKATDGVWSGTSFTSATVGNWEDAGVEAGDYLIEWSNGAEAEIISVSGTTLTLDDTELSGESSLDFEIRSGGNTSDSAYWIDADRGGIWPHSMNRVNRVTAIKSYPPLMDANESPAILGTVSGTSLQFDREATTDDGSVFSCTITIGPFALSRSAIDRGLLRAIRPILTPETLSGLTMRVRGGAFPEEVAENPSTPLLEALDEPRQASYSLQATKYQQTFRPRVAGHAAVIFFTGSGSTLWGIESIDLEIGEAGRTR